MCLVLRPITVLAQEQSETEISRELEENYTSTELKQARIALRAEVFEGFTGTISVMLREKSGLLKQCTLNSENFYEQNIMVNSGTYQISKVEAYDDQYLYEVIYQSDAYPLAEQGILMFRVQVVGIQIGDVQTKSETEAISDDEVNVTEEEKLSSGQKEQSGEAEKNKYIWIIWITGIVCGAVYLKLRNKKNRYE